jgi:hypothetical protein
MIDPSKPTAPEPDRYHQLVSSKLPDWLATTEPEHRQLMRQAASRRDPELERACQEKPAVARALMQTYSQHLQAEAALQTLLAKLPALEPYATDLLSQAIRKRFCESPDTADGKRYCEPINVSKTYLFNRGRAEAIREAFVKSTDSTESAVSKGKQANDSATQSLLHSALQNFEAYEAQPEGMSDGRRHSAIIDNKDYFSTPEEDRLPIVAEDFAALARELDIGGKYQTLLDSLDPPATHPDVEAVRAVFEAAERSTFHLHVHHAYLLGKFDKAIYETLLNLDSASKVEHAGRPVLCSSIKLLSAPLTGAMAIGIDARIPRGVGRFPPDSPYPYDGWLVLYLPGMPEPLTYHASRAHAEAFLSEQLRTLHYPDHLKLIPDRHRSAFLKALMNKLAPLEWSLLSKFVSGIPLVRTPDPNAHISLQVTPFSHPYAEALAIQQQQRLRDDALFHAVPTAMQDKITVLRHFAYFEAIALDIFNIGGIFIPAIGAAALAVTVVQLANETFEGIGSWLEGDRLQALSYLMDVIENVAFIMLLKKIHEGGEIPVVERVPVETPSFIEELKPVEMPDGSGRLWQPDLAPFAHDKVLPASLEPDEFGLYHHEGKTWLPVEDRVFSVKRTGSEHRLEHPTRTDSYEPPALHNGAGAWLLETERPQTWSGPDLLRRMGHLSAYFDKATLQQTLEVSDIHEDVLRRVLAENQRLPALLEDTLQRFKLDRDIKAMHPDWPASQLNAEFKRQYQSLPGSQQQHAPLIQRIYPGLPAPITDELLRNASASELQLLGEGKVPKRLGEEVRLYQQQVRLARAYEGLYLNTVHSDDIDRLILQSVGQLADFPADLKVELYEGSFKPGLLDSIGPDQAAKRWLITRYTTGYAATTPFPSEPVTARHKTLLEALHEGLALPGLADASALLERIRQAPRLPRWALRKQLKMQRASFRSPMRLADGRFGYLLSPTPWFDDLTLLDRFTRFYVRLTQIGVAPATASQILNALQEVPMGAEQAEVRLNQMAESAISLQASLDQWRSTPGQIADANFSIYSRDTIENALWTHWMHASIPEFELEQGRLYLNQTFLSEFPANLPPSFAEGIRHLHLDDIAVDHAPAGNLTNVRARAMLGNLFQHFPHLQILEIERPYAADAPPFELQNNLDLVNAHFPQLREMRLINLNLLISAQAIDQLASTVSLDLLDLSGNRLIQAPDAVVGNWRLQYLGLERMSLDQWPQWLDATILGRIDYVSLRGSALSDVPGYLQFNPLDQAHSTVITLEGNPLPEQLVQNLAFSQDGLPRRFSFNLDIPATIQANLRTLEAQRIELRRMLHQWALQGENARLQTATDLSDFWEARVRQMGSAPLHLMNLRLEHFPAQLPAFFTEHVDHMILEGLEATRQQLDTCLRQFPRLVTLALYDNAQALHTLPEAFTNMPLLTELELVGQGLIIDNTALEQLIGLPALELLDLTSNTLSPDLRSPIRSQRRLNQLTLNDTELQTWPDWLFDVMPTQLLDLGDNRLTTLPAGILAADAVDAERTTVSLAGNPLDEQTRQLLDSADGNLKLYLPHGFRPH